MKKIITSLMISGMLFLNFNVNYVTAGTVGPRKGRDIKVQIYPEYKDFKESKIPYSLPNFGKKKHYCSPRKTNS